MVVELKEIFKLKVMLDNVNIPYEFLDRSYINYEKHELERPFYQIIVYDKETNNRLISVIEGYGTYGVNSDLLEIQGLLTDEESENDSVVGYLTAENVFKRIKDNY